MSKKVIVGMSGGVDSSVTALLLKEQGYSVTGLFMKNWDDIDDPECPAEKDYQDVLRVADKLDIPCYTVNFVKEYQELVFASFLEGLKKGFTPNPDILCNREIKFNVFFKKAKELQADFLATGHYARIGDLHGEKTLLKGLDPNKDQSYFLYTLKETLLKETLFPVGELLKPDLRKIAKEKGLPTAEKKDSTGICFIGKRDFKTFLKPYIGYTPGPFLTLEGKKVGTHDGVAFYTLGQRKGLGIGGEGEAWFVVKKDLGKNIVYVVQGKDHPSLYTSSLEAKELTLVSNANSLDLPFKCTAKIRYRQEDQPCTIEKIENGTLFVSFDSPQRAATTGQSIVFYEKERCLGGAIITSTLN